MTQISGPVPGSFFYPADADGKGFIPQCCSAQPGPFHERSTTKSQVEMVGLECVPDNQLFPPFNFRLDGLLGLPRPHQHLQDIHGTR